MTDAPNIDKLSATELLDQLNTGRTSSEAATRAYLARAAERSELNAFVTLDESGALAAAQDSDRRRASGQRPRPLEGLPIVVKDNIQWAGLPTTAGSPGLADFVPRLDAPVARTLRDAGVVLLGKTAMHEVAYGMSGWNPSFSTGPEIGVRNAYDPARMSGGSSAGNGAALGARLAPAGIGTDTGGSMRIPAALNGITGMRPSTGRYPNGGFVPASHTRDTVGATGITVADVELLDRVITGNVEAVAADLRGVRLGLVPDYFERNLDGDTESAFALTVHSLRDAGVEFVRVDMPGLAELNDALTLPTTLWESHDDLVAWLRSAGTGLTIEEFVARMGSPDVRGFYESAVLPRKMPTPDGPVDLEPVYRKAISEHRPAMVELYAHTLRDNRLDAIAFPTVPAVALPAGPETTEAEQFIRFVQNTTPGANADVPGIQLPMGFGASTGLPTGFALDGPIGSDRRLLSIGMGIEAVLGRMSAPAADGQHL